MIIKPLEVAQFDKTVSIAIQYAEQLGIENYDEEHIIESIREHKIDTTKCWFNAVLGQSIVGFVGGVVGTKTLTKDIVGIIDFFYLLPEYNTEENISELTFSFIKFCEKFQSKEFFITAELDAETKHVLENNLSLTNQNIIGRVI